MTRLLFVLFFFGCGSSGTFFESAGSSGKILTGVNEGNEAIAFSGTTRTGRDFELETHRGKPVVMIFWASWCGPCMQEIPHINALVKEYGDGVQIMGINMSEAKAKVYMTQKKMGMNYETVMDPKGEIANAWRVRKLPLMVVVDKAGVIRFRGIGNEQKLKNLLDRLVAG